MPAEKIKKLMEWYERRLAPIAFLAGFVFDSFTLTRPDLLRDNLILIAHLSISGLGILAVNAYAAGRLRGERIDAIAPYFPLAIQFSFGALFSGFVVLYGRSGSLSASWPFLGTMALLLIGNELFRERYRRLIFHLGVYFVALFSYAILAIPVISGKIGAGMFLLAGAASVTGIAAFVGLVSYVAGRSIRGHLGSLAATIGGIYLAFNLLYFTNIIPPIPLALKHLDVYHTIERTTSGGYRLGYEPSSRYSIFHDVNSIYHWVPGTPIIAFSAVFAPTELKSGIAHRWLRYDEGTGDWIEEAKIPFRITGGRATGYRGYSIKERVRPGKWRVEVRTNRGQLLGRRAFTVVETVVPPPLKIRDL